MSAPVRIGILFGGPSAEHEVSCASALGVARALAGGGYRTVAIGVTRSGGFRLLPDALLAELRDRPAGARAIDDRLVVSGPSVELRAVCVPASCRCPPATPQARCHAELDVVFPVLHGPFGEDGVVQGLLEALNVPYVGCGILASAVGMNKVAMKRALRAEGVPVTPYVAFDAHTYRAVDDPEKLVVGLRRPLFVKPASMVCRSASPGVGEGDDLAAAVEEALRHDQLVMVEQGVTGRELECAVLGGWRPEASAVGEVRVAGGWFDYQQKYFGDSDPMIVPALAAGRGDRAGLGSCRCARSPRSAVGAWPGWTSSTTRRPVRCTSTS